MKEQTQVERDERKALQEMADLVDTKKLLNTAVQRLRYKNTYGEEPPSDFFWFELFPAKL